ncbi:MAG: radical SAM protein, partial [Sulfurimonas sp.]|nr:radical SAM protein [Sulfurimonas sp.]
ILAEPWLERHLHIALQHTSPQMLKHMNRRNVYKQDRELFELLADKGFAIGTDFITGHPGESQELWDEAMRNVKELPLTHLHAFTYSKRDGTPSAIMKPEVNGKLAKERLHELEAIVKSKNLEFRKAFSGNLDVLVEGEKDGLYVGYDQHFNKILIDSSEDLVGNWVNIQDYTVKEESNYGKV